MKKTIAMGVVPAAVLALASLASAQTSAVPASAVKVAAADQTFALAATRDGLAEVELGKLAREHGSIDGVKEFAAKMVEDHTKANEELAAWITSRGLLPPTEPGPEHKATAKRLSGLSGPAFDKAYAAHMVADHKKAVAAFTKASKTAKDADLQAWSAKTLLTLQAHLDHSEKLSKDVAATKAAP